MRFTTTSLIYEDKLIYPMPSFEFQAILKDAVKGLDNPLRWKILEYLVENGETSYSNLLKALNINNKGKLTFHLRQLSKSALVNRYEIIGRETGEKSFYDISPFGRSLINGLTAAFASQQKIYPSLDYQVPDTARLYSNVGPNELEAMIPTSLYATVGAYKLEAISGIPMVIGTSKDKITPGIPR